VNSAPGSGVGIAIGTPDKNGASDGATTFTRRYDSGTTTTVTAPNSVDNGTLVFVRWLRNGIPLSTNTAISVALLVDTELTAVYQSTTGPTQTYNLNVQSSNPNGPIDVDVTVSVPDINGQGSGSTTFTRLYNEGTETVLTAPETAANGDIFDYWMLDGERYSNDRTISVAMFANHVVRAMY